MNEEKIIRPRHVAIIPDGNRRWAKANGLSTFQGHERGVRMAEEVSRHAAEQGVEHLSFWGMSLDNLVKRSAREVADLLRIFRAEFKKLAVDEGIHERETRINVFGRWHERFPGPVRREIDKAMDATSSYKKRFLNFFLAYNGTDEMMQAVQALVTRARGGEDIVINEQAIKDHLFTKDLPPVDLIIRTGSDPHLSAGFMMWDAANAELFFSDSHWPDFSMNNFDQALDSYAKRRRKLGT